MTSGGFDGQERNRCEGAMRTEQRKCRCRGELRWSDLRSIGGLAARLSLVCLAVIVMSGCGKQKQELENAKQQIDRLNAETKSLTESFANLGKEKARLQESMKLLSEKNDALEREVAALKRAKASVEKENATLKAGNEEARKELESLKKERDDLKRELETLKKSAAASPAVSAQPEQKVTAAEQSAAKPPQATSPCAAVIHYMKKCEAIVRQYKGKERAKLLEQAKQESSPQMRGAPEKAIAAADRWVKEVARMWDKPREDSAFILLSNKDIVLKACHITPEQAGF